MPWRKSADAVQTFVLKSEVKDFFKFWGRLSGFLKLADIRDTHFPSLPKVTAWTALYDYIDVFARKYPRFKAAALEAWNQGNITRRLINHTVDFGGGVVKLMARWLPKGSLASRLALPVTAATALVFAREQLFYDAPAIAQKEVTFTKELAQSYHDRAQREDKGALFKEIKGAYNSRAAELLVHGFINEQVSDQLVSHIKDHLKKERYIKLSNGINSLISGGFLTYASLAGMGAVSSGSLIVLMLAPYIINPLIGRSTQVAEFTVTKQV